MQERCGRAHAPHSGGEKWPAGPGFGKISGLSGLRPGKKIAGIGCAVSPTTGSCLRGVIHELMIALTDADRLVVRPGSMSARADI